VSHSVTLISSKLGIFLYIKSYQLSAVSCQPVYWSSAFHAPVYINLRIKSNFLRRVRSTHKMAASIKCFLSSESAIPGLVVAQVKNRRQGAVTLTLPFS